MRIKPIAKKRGPWLLLFAFVIILGVMGEILASHNWQDLLQKSEYHGESDLNFLVFAARMNLQNYDYEEMDQFLMQWGEEHADHTVEIKLTTENGYQISHFKRSYPPEKTFTLSREFEYSYHGRATLLAIFDLTPAEKSLHRFVLWLVIAGLIIIFFVAYFVKETIRQQREAILFKEQAIKLDEANTLLQEEIGQRRESEKALLKSKESWERTFNAISDTICLQDPDMRIVRINEAGCKMFQATEEEIIGKHCYELFRGTSSPCPDCPMDGNCQNFIPTGEETYHPRLKKTFLISTSPIFHSEGNIEGIVHIAKDISEQKKIQKHLQRAQKMEAIGTLAGGIAHDFNNILSAILGFTDLALLEADDESLQKKLHSVKKAGYRAKELVSQILNFSRQSPLERRPILISPIIKEALKLLKASLPSSIEICQDIEDHSGKILADPTQIHQIIMNLCTNAFHAIGEENGVLTVTLGNERVQEERPAFDGTIKPGHYLKLTVADTGAGMDETILNQIFEPFFTTKGKGIGTGMGLSLVRGVVKECGGAIIVTSTPGKGSTFEIYFPQVKSGSEVEKTSVLQDLPTGRGRILLIDDDRILVEIGLQLLTTLGYEVTGAVKALEAKEIFMKTPHEFDMVITDQMMPHIRGAELAKEFLAVRPDLPVIICTGLSSSLSIDEATAIGIREVLLKPLNIYALARTIKKYLPDEN